MLISAAAAIFILMLTNPLIKDIIREPANLFQSLYSLEFLLCFYILFSILYLINSDVTPITTIISQTFYRLFFALNLCTSILTIIVYLRDILDLFLIIFSCWFPVSFVYFNTVYKYDETHPQYYLTVLIVAMYGSKLELFT